MFISSSDKISIFHEQNCQIGRWDEHVIWQEKTNVTFIVYFLSDLYKFTLKRKSVIDADIK